MPFRLEWLSCLEKAVGDGCYCSSDFHHLEGVVLSMKREVERVSIISIISILTRMSTTLMASSSWRGTRPVRQRQGLERCRAYVESS